MLLRKLPLNRTGSCINVRDFNPEPSNDPLIGTHHRLLAIVFQDPEVQGQVSQYALIRVTSTHVWTGVLKRLAMAFMFPAVATIVSATNSMIYANAYTALT